MEKTKMDYLITNLEWKICNDEFDEVVRGFILNFFKFKFRIQDKAHQKEFINLLEHKKNKLLPVDVCNFLALRNIKFSLSFRVIKNLGFKRNFDALKEVININTQIPLLKIKRIKKSFKIEVEKKMINGRERMSFLFEYFNYPQKCMYFIQADSNIWWKPKKIKEKSDDSECTSIGWLFMQIGKYTSLKSN